MINNFKKSISNQGDTNENAYVIKDKSFPDFPIKKSANAWWLDRGKVEKIIAAFKLDCTVEQACVYAGISHDQYKYFCRAHKNFYTIKAICKSLPILRARQTIVMNLHDAKNAMWYLERKNPEEFGRAQKIDLEGNLNLNEMKKIEKHLKAIAERKQIDF